jgi:hypothetical protein
MRFWNGLVGPVGRVALALLCGASLAACAQPEPVRHSLTLGTERVSVATPEGWELVDRGDAVILRKADMDLRLETIGPVGPVGIRREVERARQLWSEGRDQDSRWRLRTVRVPDALFATPAQREAFWAAWHEVSDENASHGAIAAGFDHILASVAEMKPMDHDALADAWLAQVDPHRRREVASRRALTVDGRPAIVLDTWYRVDHTQPRRIALVFDDGYALALQTGQGAFGPGPLAPQVVMVELLLGSLRFEPAAS